MLPNDFFPPTFPPGLPPRMRPNIAVHRLVEADLIRLVGNNHASLSCLASKYDQRLLFLSEHLGTETAHHQWFKTLVTPYREIRFNHVKLLGNLRIIYCVVEQVAYLLVAFQEHSSSDFAPALQTAAARASVLFQRK